MDDYDSFNPEWGDDDFIGEWGEDIPLTPEDALLREILDAYGIESIGEIVVEPKAVPEGSRIQGNRFSSLLEAVMFLHDIGILGFSNIVYLGDDEYGAAVPDKTP